MTTTLHNSLCTIVTDLYKSYNAEVLAIMQQRSNPREPSLLRRRVKNFRNTTTREQHPHSWQPQPTHLDNYLFVAFTDPSSKASVGNLRVAESRAGVVIFKLASFKLQLLRKQSDWIYS